MSTNIQVAIKFRPFIERERLEGASTFWDVLGSNEIVQRDPITRKIRGETQFFDRVFNENQTNKDVFDVIVKPIVEKAVNGFNGTVFAYGQTSSGKTYTLKGSTTDAGITKRTVDYVFELMKLQKDREFLMRASYIEIYNEKINDLLKPNNVNLKLRDQPGQVTIQDAAEEVCNSAAQILKLVERGEMNRSIAETSMNERSSRSHTIFRLIMESREFEGAETGTSTGDGAIQVSHLNLVDLAGSERTGQMNATGQQFKEGCNINKSLSTLGKVISDLSDGKQYVNYRDSKLTRILQNSLGGNALTAIICTVTPAALDQTINTLGFATRAKTINNKPKVNEVLSDEALLRRMARQMDKLQSELANAKGADLQNLQAMSSQLKEKDELNERLQQRLNLMKEQLINSTVAVAAAEMDEVSAARARALRRQTWCGKSRPASRLAMFGGLRSIQEKLDDSAASGTIDQFETPLEDFEQELIDSEEFKLNTLEALSNSSSTPKLPAFFGDFITVRRKSDSTNSKRGSGDLASTLNSDAADYVSEFASVKSWGIETSPVQNNPSGFVAKCKDTATSPAKFISTEYASVASSPIKCATKEFVSVATSPVPQHMSIGTSPVKFVLSELENVSTSPIKIVSNSSMTAHICVGTSPMKHDEIYFTSVATSPIQQLSVNTTVEFDSSTTSLPGHSHINHGTEVLAALESSGKCPVVCRRRLQVADPETPQSVLRERVVQYKQHYEELREYTELERQVPNSELQEKLHAVTAENIMLQSKLESLEQAGMESTTLTEENRALRAAVGRLKSVATDREVEMEALVAKNRRREEDLRAMLEEAYAQIGDIPCTADTVDHTLLSEELDAVKRERAELSSANLDLQTKLDAIALSQDSCSAQVESLCLDRVQAEERNAYLERQIETLESLARVTLSDAELQASRLAEEKSQMEERIVALQSESSLLRSQVERLEAHNETLKAAESVHESEVLSLASRLAIVEGEKLEMDRRNVDLEAQILSLKEHVSSMESPARPLLSITSTYPDGDTSVDYTVHSKAVLELTSSVLPSLWEEMRQSDEVIGSHNVADSDPVAMVKSLSGESQSETYRNDDCIAYARDHVQDTLAAGMESLVVLPESSVDAAEGHRDLLESRIEKSATVPMSGPARDCDNSRATLETRCLFAESQNKRIKNEHQEVENGLRARLQSVSGQLDDAVSEKAALLELVERLKMQKANVEAQCVSLRAEMKTTTAASHGDTASLCARLDTVSAENSALLSQQRELESRLTSLNDCRVNLESRNATATTQIELLEKELQQAYGQMMTAGASFQEESQDRSSRLETMEEANGKLREHVAALETSGANAMARIRELVGEKKCLEREKGELKEQLSTLEELYESLDETLSEMKGKLSALETRNRSLEGENNERKAQLCALERHSESLEGEKSKLVAQVSALEGRNPSLDLDVSQFNTELWTAQRLDRSISDGRNTEVELLALEERNRSLQVEMSQLEVRLSYLEALNLSLQEVKAELEVQLVTVQEQHQLLQEEQGNMEAKLLTSKTHYQSLEVEKNNVTVELRSVKKLNQSLEEHKSKMEARLTTLEELNQSLKEDRNTMETKLTTLESVHRSLEEEKSRMEAKLTTLEELNHTLEVEKNNVTAKLMSVEKLNQSLEEYKSKMEAKLTTLELNQFLKEDRNTMETKLTTLESVHRFLEEDKSRLEAKLTTLEELNHTLEVEKYNLTAELMSVEKLNQSLEEHKTKMEAKLTTFEELNQSLKEDRNTMKTKLTALENLNHSLEEHKSKMEAKLTTLKELNHFLEKDLNKVKGELMTAEKHNHLLEEDKKKVKTEFLSLEELNKSLMTAKHELVVEVSELETRNQFLEAQAASLQASLEATQIALTPQQSVSLENDTLSVLVLAKENEVNILQRVSAADSWEEDIIGSLRRQIDAYKKSLLNEIISLNPSFCSEGAHSVIDLGELVKILLTTVMEKEVEMIGEMRRSYEDEKQMLLSRVDSLESKLLHNANWVKEVEGDHEKLQQELSESMEACATLSAKLKALVQEVENLTESKQLLAEEVNRRESKLQVAEAEMASIRAGLREGGKVSFGTQRIDELEHIVDEQARLHEMQAMKLACCEGQMELMLNRNHALTKEAEAREAELFQALSERDSLETEIKQLGQDVVASRHLVVSDISKRLGSLSESLCQEGDDLDTILDSVEHRLLTSQSDASNLKHLVEESRKRDDQGLKEQRERIVMLEARVTELQATADGRNPEEDRSRREISRLERRYKETKKKLEERNEKINQLQQEIDFHVCDEDDVTDYGKRIKELKEQVRAACKERDEKIEQLEREIRDHTCVTGNIDVDIVREQVRKLEEQLRQSEADNTFFDFENEEMLSMLNKVQEEWQQMHVRYTTLESEAAEMRACLESTVLPTAGPSVHPRPCDCAALQEKVTSLSLLLADRNGEVSRLEAEVSRNSDNQLVLQLKQTIAEREALISRLQAEVARTSGLPRQDKLVLQLKRALAERTTMVSNLQAEVSRISALPRNDDLVAQLRQAVSERDMVVTSLQLEVSRLQGATEEVAALTEELQETKLKLAGSKGQLARLRIQIDCEELPYRNEVEGLRKEAAEAGNRVATLKTELRRAQMLLHNATVVECAGCTHRPRQTSREVQTDPPPLVSPGSGIMREYNFNLMQEKVAMFEKKMNTYKHVAIGRLKYIKQLEAEKENADPTFKPKY